MDFTRRDFARRAGLATAALSYSRILGANDRVRMGYIGLGNRGDQVHDAFLEYGDQQTVAICDLRDDYLDNAARKSRANPARYKDYRKLLDNKNVDAVVIATPDHWHALMMIDACEAGKDVYVEKPLSLTVVEGRKMVQAAERTKRVVQVGIQRRSSPALIEAARLVREGAIGQVTVAKGYHIVNEWPRGIGNPPDGAPPDAETWEKWLGPAPMVPYNKNRTFYRFRWFYDYSGGQVTNFGVHYMDMLRWCLGQDSPSAVTVLGGKYAIKDNREIPDTLEALWQFDGAMVIFCQYNANGAPSNLRNSEIELRGTKGTMYINYSGWEIVPEPVTEEDVPARSPVDRDHEKAYLRSHKTQIQPQKRAESLGNNAHARNFLDCVKSRAQCNCDIVTGHLSTSATLIANIAHKTRSFLEWDAAAERFTNNQAANRYLSYKYRAPYELR
ncbi:MAG: Gfo/Idh/MocA family protein [Acidobacteriota bacterium]